MALSIKLKNTKEQQKLFFLDSFNKIQEKTELVWSLWQTLS
jgi:hypothetical protein